MEIIHAYDVDTELLPALLARFGPEVVERFDIGPSGNLLHLDIDKMEDVDLIIAGPPCPPFSSIGSKRGAGMMSARNLSARCTIFCKTNISGRH